MSPPELARHVPIADALEPVFEHPLEALRRERDATVARRCQRRFGQRLHLDEPLQRQQRLDRGVATVACADAGGVRVLVEEQTPFFEALHGERSCLEAVHAYEFRLDVAGKFRVEADDRWLRQLVALADL